MSRMIEFEDIKKRALVIATLINSTKRTTFIAAVEQMEDAIKETDIDKIKEAIEIIKPIIKSLKKPPASEFKEDIYNIEAEIKKGSGHRNPLFNIKVSITHGRETPRSRGSLRYEVKTEVESFPPERRETENVKEKQQGEFLKARVSSVEASVNKLLQQIDEDDFNPELLESKCNETKEVNKKLKDVCMKLKAKQQENMEQLQKLKSDFEALMPTLPSETRPKPKQNGSTGIAANIQEVSEYLQTLHKQSRIAVEKEQAIILETWQDFRWTNKIGENETKGKKNEKQELSSAYMLKDITDHVQDLKKKATKLKKELTEQKDQQKEFNELMTKSLDEIQFILQEPPFLIEKHSRQRHYEDFDEVPQQLLSKTFYVQDTITAIAKRLKYDIREKDDKLAEMEKNIAVLSDEKQNLLMRARAAFENEKTDILDNLKQTWRIVVGPNKKDRSETKGRKHQEVSFSDLLNDIESHFKSLQESANQSRIAVEKEQAIILETWQDFRWTNKIGGNKTKGKKNEKQELSSAYMLKDITDHVQDLKKKATKLKKKLTEQKDQQKKFNELMTKSLDEIQFILQEPPFLIEKHSRQRKYEDFDEVLQQLLSKTFYVQDTITAIAKRLKYDIREKDDKLAEMEKNIAVLSDEKQNLLMRARAAFENEKTDILDNLKQTWRIVVGPNKKDRSETKGRKHQEVSSSDLLNDIESHFKSLQESANQSRIAVEKEQAIILETWQDFRWTNKIGGNETKGKKNEKQELSSAYMLKDITDHVQDLKKKATRLKKELTEQKDQQKEFNELMTKSLYEIQFILQEPPFLIEKHSRQRKYEDFDEVPQQLLSNTFYVQDTITAIAKRLKYDIREKDDKLAEMEKNIAVLSDEKQNLLMRLSMVPGANLMDNNPNIADLSDTNRPTNIGKNFSELFDNQWTNVYELLENSKMNETDIISFLLQILQGVFGVCEKYARRQNVVMSTLLVHPTDEIDFTKLTEDSKDTAKLPAVLSRGVIDLRKQSFNECSKDIINFLQQKEKKWFQKGALTEYTVHCVELCWLMQMQTLPLHIDTETHADMKFDKNKYKEYTKMGKKVDFLVWPALLLHKDGPMLSKGVAQGK